MNKMKNLRCSFLPLWILCTGIFIIACSNDENKELTKDEVVVDNDIPLNYNNLSVSYQLLNKDSIPVRSFKEGENIVFQLKITNNRDSAISLPLIPDIIGDDAFMVYTSDGKVIGKPWKSFSIITARHPRLQVQHSLTFEVPWLEGTVRPDLCFSEWGNQPPLAKGSYYTQFPIALDMNSDRKVLCRKEFVVK